MDISRYLTHSKAIDFLSENLTKGYLNLFLGSGVSSSFGLPSWDVLINRMILLAVDENLLPASHDLIANTDSTPDELQRLAERLKQKIKNEDKLLEFLSRSLYEGIQVNNLHSIIQNKLLISLGALLIGSKRGKVNQIMTLNYDNIIEWYLSLYGYISNSIYDLPKLEGNEDVRILHPHGYIPHPDLDNTIHKGIIFDFKSVNERLGKPGDIWNEKMRNFLRSGICLFVGLSYRSFKDFSLSPTFTLIGTEIKSLRPLGFWIICDPISQDEENDFLDYRIVPIRLDKTNVPDFIFKICSEASKKV